MWEVLKLIFAGQNQFASGGLVLMVVGAIGVYLRALPRRLWNWIVNQSTLTSPSRMMMTRLFGRRNGFSIRNF